VDKVNVIALLVELNPGCDLGILTMYADVFETYTEAQENIGRNGAINMHPKTGAPIQNPYLAVRDTCLRQLMKLDVETGNLWGG